MATAHTLTKMRALRARAILLVFEKFTRAYLFQIALEIMWLPIQIRRKMQ